MSSKPKIIEASTAIGPALAATSTGFEAAAPRLTDETTTAAASLAADTQDEMAKAATGLTTETQAKVKQGMEKAMKTAEELMAFSQGNLEAMVKSGQIWAAGVQDIGKQLAATAQASFDETMSTFKAMSSVKSLKDAFDLQASLARATVEKTLAESGKLTDASVKLTEQTLAPLTARVSLAMEKFAKAA